ncbi:MAG: O-antigen ligase family protein [bacterium]|nr:O-antigen ligase family protein [bacterium]
MVKRKSKADSSRAQRPRERTAASFAPAAPVTASVPAVPSAPAIAWVCLWTLILAQFLVVAAMTAYTYSLDDIKVPIFHIAGPGLMLAALAAILWGGAPWPGRWVGRGLLAFGAAVLLSTLASHYRWIGWEQLLLLWSAAGFCMAALVAGAWRRTASVFVKFLVLQLLFTNLVGVFCFDFFGNPDHYSGVAWLYRALYANAPPSDPLASLVRIVFRDLPVTRSPAVYNLLWTFFNADSGMLSTILNRDFYAGFCILYLPFAVSMVLAPDSEKHPRAWQMIGLLTAFLTVVCVFYCQSKGEWIFVVISMALYAAGFMRVGRLRHLRLQHLAAFLAGLAVFLATVAWMKSPSLVVQLKSLNYSFGSRGIIWNGALGIFKAFPLLGGGPGTFRVYFPAYRRPDYFEHEISNLTLSAHNYFLNLLCETGALGLACHLVFAGAILLLGLRWMLRHRDERLRLELLTVLTGLVAMYGSNLSSPNACWVIGATQLWTVLGFGAGLLRQAEGWPAGRPPASSRAAFWPGRVLPSFFLVIGVPLLFLSGRYGVRYYESALQYADGRRYMDDENAKSTEDKIAELKLSAGFFAKAIAINSGNLSAYYKLGSVYQTLSTYIRRQAEDAAAAHDAQTAGLKTATADDYLAQALDTYNALARLAPDYAEIHYNYGIIYNDLANMRLRQADALDPKTRGAETEALRQEAARDNQLALDHLDRMLKMSRKADVASLAGSQYLVMGLIPQARDVYRDASRRYPDNDELTRQYDITAADAGDWPGVAEALERLWRRHPADDAMLTQLIEVASRYRLDAVLMRVLDRLEQINPVSPMLWQARLRLDARLGRDREALRDAQRYRKLGGRDAADLWLGAEAARRLGETAPARELYQQVTAGDAASTYAAEARRRLASGAQ